MLKNPHSLNKLKPKFFFQTTETIGIGEANVSKKPEVTPNSERQSFQKKKESPSIDCSPIQSKYINAWDTFSANRLKYENQNTTNKKQSQGMQYNTSEKNLGSRNFSKIQQKLIDFEKTENILTDKFDKDSYINSNNELPSNLKGFYSKYGILSSDRVVGPEYNSTKSVNSSTKYQSSNNNLIDINRQSESNYTSLVDIKSRYQKVMHDDYKSQSLLSSRHVSEKKIDSNVRQILQETQRTDDQVLRDFFDYKLQGISELNNMLSERRCKEKDSLDGTISQIKRDTKHLVHLKDLFTKKNAAAKKHNDSLRSSTIQRAGDLNLKLMELEREWKDQIKISNEDVRRRMEEFENGLLEMKKQNHLVEIRTQESYKIKNENLKENIETKTQILDSIKAEYEEMRSENQTVVKKIQHEIAPTKKHAANYEESLRRTEENISEKQKQFYELKSILEVEVIENQEIEAKLEKLHDKKIFKEKKDLRNDVSLSFLLNSEGAELLKMSYEFESILQAEPNDQNECNQLSDAEYIKNCIQEIDENQSED